MNSRTSMFHYLGDQQQLSQCNYSARNYGEEKIQVDENSQEESVSVSKHAEYVIADKNKAPETFN